MPGRLPRRRMLRAGFDRCSIGCVAACSIDVVYFFEEKLQISNGFRFFIIVMNSVWLWLIPAHSTQMYGASATLGFGGSTLLVTVLTMLADLIGDNVVRKLLTWLLAFSLPKKEKSKSYKKKQISFVKYCKTNGTMTDYC